MRAEAASVAATHMRYKLLHQFPMLILIPASIETNNPSRSFQTVTCHLQLVHRVDILNMALHGRPIWCSSEPHVQVFMAPCFKEERVVATVQIGEFVE